jgi:YHS domain-containing protein
MTEPGSGNPFLLFPEMPPLCRVCQMPCIFPRVDVNTIRIREHAGRRHAFCSQPCERIFDEDPGRYLGYRTFWEIWDGHGLDEYIVKQGLLRADGKTLLPQPHNSDDPRMMWTLDDITALDVEIRDPLTNPESIYVVS